MKSNNILRQIQLLSSFKNCWLAMNTLRSKKAFILPIGTQASLETISSVNLKSHQKLSNTQSRPYPVINAIMKNTHKVSQTNNQKELKGECTWKYFSKKPKTISRNQQLTTSCITRGECTLKNQLRGWRVWVLRKFRICAKK